MNPQRIIRVCAIVILLSTCSISGATSTFQWNNATDGLWKSDRWFTDNPNNLVCCPGSADSVAINATATSLFDVRLFGSTDVRLPISQFEIGLPDGSSKAILSVFGLLATFVPGSPVVAHNGSIMIFYSSTEMMLSSQANALFNRGSVLVLSGGSLKCAQPRNCNYLFDGGSFLLDYPAVNTLSDVTLYLDSPRSPVIQIAQQSRLDVINSNVTYIRAYFLVTEGVHQVYGSGDITWQNSIVRITPSLVSEQTARLTFYEQSAGNFINSAIYASSGGYIYSQSSNLMFENTELVMDVGAQFLSSHGAEITFSNGSIDLSTSALMLFDETALSLSETTLSVVTAAVQANANSLTRINGSHIGLRLGSGMIVDNSTAFLRDTVFELSGDSYVKGATESGSFFENCSFAILSASSLICDNSNMYINGGSTVAISSYVIARFGASVTFCNTAFHSADMSTVAVINSAELTIADSFVSIANKTKLLVSNNGAIILDRSYLTSSLASEIAIIGHSTLQTFNSSISMSFDSKLVCGNSTVQFSNLLLSGWVYPQSCNFSADNITGLGAQIEAKGSNFSFGATKFVDSRTLFTLDSTIRIRGDIELQNSIFLLLNATMTVPGSISTSQCAVPDFGLVYTPWTTDEALTWDSCLVALMESSIDCTGDLLLGYGTFLYVYNSRITALGGITVGGSSLGKIEGGVFSYAGITSIGRATRFIYEQAAVNVAGGVSLGLVAQWAFNSSQVVVSGSLLMDYGSSVPCAGRTTMEVAGDITMNGAQGSHPVFVETGLSCYGSASVHISGGSIHMSGNSSVLRAMGGGNITLNQGSILASGSATISVHDQSSVTVRSGGIVLNHSLLNTSNSFVSIDGGNLTVTNGSVIKSKRSSFTVQGSVQMKENARWWLLDESTLIVAGGIVDLDASSVLVIDENSLLVGTGLISGSVVVYNGTISHQQGTAPSTELQLGTLTQSNSSRFEATISASFGPLGTSTRVNVGSATLGGTLSISIDANMLEQLKTKPVDIIISETDLVGDFDKYVVAGQFIETSSNPTCGAMLQRTARSVSVLFAVRGCPSPVSTPLGLVETSSNTAAIVAGILVPLFAVLVIVVIIVIIKVPRLRNAITPWRKRETGSAQNEITLMEPERASSPRNTGNWTAASPQRP